MNQDHESQQAARRIVLPSGRTIEVIRFEEPAQAPRQLHICPDCDSQLVQPLAWHECPDGRCELVLECPNCEWIETGTHERRQVDSLEDQLDDGLAEMIADLQSLTHANMSAEVERFSAALRHDLILPEDF